MISRIEGSLVDIESGRAHLRCGALVYEVLTPAADHGRLAICIGETVEDQQRDVTSLRQCTVAIAEITRANSVRKGSRLARVHSEGLRGRTRLHV